MYRTNKNSTAPVILKAAVSAFILFLSVLNFTSSAFSAQAFDQLNAAASGLEIPLVLPPVNSTRDTAAPGFNIFFISVGQGDSEYIELPDGQNVLIDGGPSTSANSSLAQFLKKKNITKISHVVLTHPHSDHYSGLQYVFSHITVGDFYDTRMDNTGSSTDDKLRAQVKSLGVPTVYPSPGDNFSWGTNVEAKVFNSCPDPVASSDGTAINNCSIVLKLSYNGISALFDGDAQSDVEAAMLSKFGSELKADVLKVGHHGSQYSSTSDFLNAVKPARAYIEVGTGNTYGFPTQAALSRLQAAGAQIFRTDQDGTQEITTAGSGGISQVSYKDFLPADLGAARIEADNTSNEDPGDN